MKFNEYQHRAAEYDTMRLGRDITGGGFMEKILGLVGEAGETADKFKKIIRDKNGQISNNDREAIVKELGDIMWYIAMISRYLDVPFDDVAQLNLKKLETRKEHGQLHGDGDDR